MNFEKLFCGIMVGNSQDGAAFVLELANLEDWVDERLEVATKELGELTIGALLR